MGGSVVRRGLTAAIALACVCVLFGASGGGYAAAPTTLTMALGIDEDTLDPEGQTTATVSNVVDYMYDPLVWYNDERSGVAPGQPQYTKITPQLATSWTVGPDGRTFTFKLRQGVKFQDGTAFDAQAVKFNIQRWLDPAVRNNSRYFWSDLDVNNIETPDPYTIVLHFTKPAPTLLEQLATTAVEIVSPTAVKTLGNEKIALAPVNAGSGPYIFKEWVHGDHLTVTRNPDYWGRKPYFDQVTFRVVPDAGARETMLRAGDVQFAFEPPAPDVPAMRKDASLRVVEGASDRVIFIGMNNLYGPLKDVRVRQALNYAVNKQAIVHSVLFGLANVMDSPDTPAIFGYTRVQAGGWPFNPTLAKKMLAEAGYPNGFTIALPGADRPVHSGLPGRAGDRGTARKRRGDGPGADRRLAELHRRDRSAAGPDPDPNVHAGAGRAVPRYRQRALRTARLGDVAPQRILVRVLQGSQVRPGHGDRPDDRQLRAAGGDLQGRAGGGLEGRALDLPVEPGLLRRDEQPLARA